MSESSQRAFLCDGHGFRGDQDATATRILRRCCWHAS
jgi:hypothetical protein